MGEDPPRNPERSLVKQKRAPTMAVTILVVWLCLVYLLTGNAFLNKLVHYFLHSLPCKKFLHPHVSDWYAEMTTQRTVVASV
jgi:hypothetical protein